MSRTAEHQLTRLQRARKALGLTQAKVASDLHIDARTVYIIESGINLSRAKKLYTQYIESVGIANNRQPTELEALEQLAERLGYKLSHG